ncbi:HAMP domain-containing sensor histidine kinase [Jatrophihabitans sp.]|uniref:sensor histidine kinase n=1 Tax=Jatrophihabitans sp. TaxID=1932789 RepID=UPI0030C67996|nr:histidine kinase [Jatrophihabitans sp.]
MRRLVARLRPRTLRTRIVVGIVALLAVGFVVIALATTLALSHFLAGRLDSQLAAAGSRYSINLEHDDHDADNPGQFQSVEGQAVGTLGARILDGVVTAAAVIGRHDDQAAVSPEARAVLARLPIDSKPHTVHLPDLGAYRVVVARGQDGDVLVTGLPLQGVHQTIGHLVSIEVIVFLAALLVIGVAVAVGVRRTLRPLGRVAETAAEIARRPMGSGAVSLPERAPVGAQGTEVATVASAVNTLLEQVEGALQMRQASEERLRAFIADASHELRTPVAVIRGHAELAQRMSASPAQTEEVRASLRRIVGESERIGHLVDDLLLLARLDAGVPLQPELMDLTHVVLDAVADARVTAPEHSWQLVLPAEPLEIEADGTAMHQVVANLLANARTHTPPGTNVRTRLRLLDGQVELSVSDDGPGVPAALASRVFERFVRGADARSTTTGSSGLGLPIVAAIVAAHGGTISLDGDHGCTVTVLLPAQPQSASAPS